MISNSSVLVTGGAGFIGSNLIEYLLARKNKVVCLDNFLTGRRQNLEGFRNNPDFRLIEGDIRSAADCAKACGGMEYVLHEAALGSVPRSIAEPEVTMEINVTGFVNVLNAARAAGVRRLAYATSSSVYGDDPSPVKHEDVIGTPLSPYAISKYTDELIARNFTFLHGFQTVGLRYFNVFGRRQDPNGVYAAVIPKFATALLKHTPPVINGDGSVSRDFTYVDNVVRANMLALTSPLPECGTAVCNIACGSRMDLNQLFDALRENLLKFDSGIAGMKPVYGPPRQGDIQDSLADVSLAEKLLGYKPEVSAAEGIARASEWYFKHYMEF